MVTEICNRENNRENKAFNIGEDTFIVAVNAEGRTKVFRNRDFEYVVGENCQIIARTNTLEEALDAEKRYLYRNTNYFVIAIRFDNELRIKIRKYVGVVEKAPIGTVGLFRKRKQAKRLMLKLKKEFDENKQEEKSAASA